VQLYTPISSVLCMTSS